MSSVPKTQPNRHISDVRPEFVVLGFLSRKSTHGYDLYRQFEQRLGRVWHISQSQMYALIKRLEIQGLILPSGETSGTGISRKCLAVSERGREHFETWLKTPSVCSARIIRLEYVSRLFFSVGSGESSVDAIVNTQVSAAETELARHEELLAELDEGDTYNRLGIGFRVNQMRAILAWLRESASIIQ